MAAICFVTDQEPGIERRGTKRFRYVDQVTGETVRDDGVIKRIESLAIPPAWTDVWICLDPTGHIQATGRDAKGRKQYRYHPDFRSRRERRKFQGLVPFGEALGGLRQQVESDLARRTLCQERVVAAAVALLERTFVRVGNEGYARTNRTYGLTTLRDRHARIDGGEVRLCFTGKNGTKFEVSCDDRRLARIVSRCRDLPGQALFQYVNDDGDPCPISSHDVNGYLRDHTGVDATAKTFRTWGASLLAAQQLIDFDPPTSQRELGSNVKAALQPVAARLGNTVAVCRASYVHPTILRRYEDGSLAERWADGPSRAAKGLEPDERRLLHVLTLG